MQFQFVPSCFVDNLKYMGLGMLGIFVAIGLIALSTVILNVLSNKNKDDENK